MSFWQDGDLLTPSNLQNRAGGADTVTVEGDNSTRATKATAVQNAIDAATNNNKSFVFVPESFTNYDASSVTFDNSVRMIREGQIADVYDVKAYGAAGDNSTDDTAAVQAAIDAAIESNGDGAEVFLPASDDYRIGSSLNIGPTKGLILRGFGQGRSILHWEGNNTDPLLGCDDINSCLFENFGISSSSTDGLLNIAIRLRTTSDAAPSGKNIRPGLSTFRNIRIDGTNTGGLNRGFSVEAGTGGDANNDFYRCYDVTVTNYDDVAWYNGHSQAKQQKFINCSFTAGAGSGTSAVENNHGSFRWYGGFVGGHSDCDFLISSADDPILISGADGEGGNRLLRTDGPTSNPVPILIESTRWAGNGLNADGIMIKMLSPGPLTLIGNFFGASASQQTVIQYGMAHEFGFVCLGNSFEANSTATPFSLLERHQGQGSARHGRVLIDGNKYNAAADLSHTFSDGDATPSVFHGRVFFTNNSAATTITGFDDGHTQQRITVIFGDGNTTIDFTGTNLKGNSGSDWSPSENDHMTCVYDGTNWYCDISDNTA